MIDITYDNFETELVAASMQTPVLLDIWAPWCGPCKQLGPVLEQLEQDYAGRFTLAKLNADDVPDIASQLSQMFGVRSIPFCVMFAQGQPVDGFVGAIPTEKIREFIDKHVPADDGSAGAHTPETEADAPLAGDAEEASTDPTAALEQALAQTPTDDELRLKLMRHFIEQAQLAQAQAVFEPVASRATGPLPEARMVAHRHYLTALQAAQQAQPADALQALLSATPRAFDTRFELAQVHFSAGHFTQAMDELLEIIMRDKAWEDEKARKTYVAILEVMSKPVPKPTAPAPTSTKDKPTLALAGTQHVSTADPVLDQYRRKLSMALF